MVARNNGHGRQTAAKKMRRNRTIAIAVVLALVVGAFGIGYVLASGGDDDVPMPASPSSSFPGSFSGSPSASSEPSESPPEEANESVSAAPAGALLPGLQDGEIVAIAQLWLP